MKFLLCFIIFTFEYLLVIRASNVCYRANKIVTVNYCSGNRKSLSIGDFNGDGKDDFVCHNSNDGTNIITYAPRKPFEPQTSQMRDKWCSGVHSRFFTGDFNGDGRTDFLCHTTNKGYKWISFADQEGNFVGTNWHRNMRWCSHGGAQLLVGDFNGDGRTDILCHDKNSGYKWISYADRNGHFYRTNWHRLFPKCNGELLTGDFNGDRKTDILCHEKKTGKKYIAFAGSSNNVFTRNNWSGNQGWCRHRGSFLRIGDINGDGRSDLICKDSAGGGSMWYSKNTGHPNYFISTTFYSRFCSLSQRKNFYLADVNGDNKHDFLCINSLGHVQVGISYCH